MIKLPRADIDSDKEKGGCFLLTQLPHLFRQAFFLFLPTFPSNNNRWNFMNNSLNGTLTDANQFSSFQFIFCYMIATPEMG